MYLKTSVGSLGAACNTSAIDSPVSLLLTAVTPTAPAGDEEPSGQGVGLRDMVPRLKREFVPQEKKDASYWNKRGKNNDAAKKSREKRRLWGLEMERSIFALTEENKHLKTELLTLQYQLGIVQVSPHSQVWLRKVLSNFLPVFGTLSCQCDPDSISGASPPSGCWAQAKSESPRKDSLGLPNAFRLSDLIVEGASSKERQDDVGSKVYPALSGPQGLRPLPRTSWYTSTDLQDSGSHARLPHKLRFKPTGMEKQTIRGYAV